MRKANYDKAPATGVEGEIILGWEAILAKIKAQDRPAVAVEVYPEPTKMKKQMGYADDKQIPFVAIVGGNEMETNTVMLKNMTTGEQKQVTLDELCTIR